MEVLLTPAFIAAFVVGTMTVAIPLLLAGLGEQISEKAGVINIGLEGMMLTGAFCGFAIAHATGSFTHGFLGGIAGGIAIAAIMAFLCVKWRINQIVVGLAITLAVQGATSLAWHVLYERDVPRLPRPPEVALPSLSELPYVGTSLFTQNPVAYVALALVVILSWLFRRTAIGLNLTAAGEKPIALDVSGVSVAATRRWAVLATGALAGLAGAYLAEVGEGLFVPLMTGGQGFIAIALVMLARPSPFLILLGALAIGAATSIATALQAEGFQVPSEVVQMMPFATVLVLLALFGRHPRVPAALGFPYRRGAR